MAVWESSDRKTSRFLSTALQSFSKISSIFVILIGITVLLGWSFQIDFLKSVLPGSVAMKVNTAVGLLLSGTALRFWHQQPTGRWTRLFGQASAIVVLLIGLLTLGEYVFSVDLGIDQVWIKTPIDPLGDAAPGRMAVHAAFCFLLVGVDLLLLNRRRARALPAQILASIIFLIALSGLLGYLFGNAVFYRIGSPTSMALHTSIGFLLLSLGILFARPQHGAIAIFVRMDTGGILARRLIPSVIVIPPLVCWLLLLGARAQIYTLELGMCLLSILIVLVFTLIISTYAEALSRFDQQNQQAQDLLQKANAELEHRVDERTSQLRQLSAEIEQQLRLFDAIASAVPDFIYTFDLAGRFTYVNQPLLDLWQKTLSESVGKDFFELDYPTELAFRLQRQVQQVITTRQPLKDETPYTSALGTRAYEYILVPLFGADNTVEGVAGITRDITERKCIEVEREQILHRTQTARRAAEETNRIKDEFLAVLSHELRTPLNPILGWSKLLQSRKLNEVRTTQALETIERNARLQSQLIEDLLDVSRILRGKLTLNVAPVALKPMIESAIETVQLAAEAKNIKMETVFEPDVSPVSGDQGRLQQVVWNLLSNSVKFTPDGGRVEIRLTQKDRQAQIQVSDTGKGISPHFLPYVFEHFRQEDGAITRKFGGLGLGLAIARQIVELHGGTIEANSAGEGLGTTFTVRLPSMHLNSAIMAPAAQTVSSTVLTGLRVLVVDDETDARALVQFILEQEGAIVTGAASAHEALQVLRESQIDFLISDIGMADFDGYMLMEQIRSEKIGQACLPAIALTAYAGDLNQQKAREAGFSQHLSKPLDPEKLLVAVITLVDRFGK